MKSTIEDAKKNIKQVDEIEKKDDQKKIKKETTTNKKTENNLNY